MNQQIVDQVRLVANLREAEAEATRQYTDSRVRWEEENRLLFEQRDRCQVALATAEADLRAMALTEFNATGNTRPGPGVHVKNLTRLIYCTEAALTWATAHSLALALDKRRFEQLAKAGAVGCDIVQEVFAPQAQIASDLYAALSAAFPEGG